MGMVYFGVSAALTAVGMVLFADGASRTKNAWYLTGSFLLLYLLAALRAPSVGTDFPTYLEQFRQAAKPLEIVVQTSRFEWGYLLFSKCLGAVSVNSVWFTAVTSGCILLPIALLISRYSKMVWLSVCLFASLLLYAMSMTAIRQYLALAILLCGLPLLQKSRLLFCLVVLAAASFHATALLFLLVPLLYTVRFTRRSVLLLAAAGMGAFLAADGIIDVIGSVFPRYALYRFGSYHTGLHLFSFVKLALFGAVLLLSWACGYDRRLSIEHRPNTELLCGCLAFLLTLLEIQATVYDRAVDYFAIFIIILLPNVLSDIRDKHARLLGIWVVVAGSFAYEAVVLWLRGAWYHVMPYAFFFSRQ